MKLFSYCPGNSIFHNLDPRVKLFLLLTMSIAIFSVTNLFLIVAVFVLIILLWTFCGLPTKNLMKMFKTLSFLFVFLTLIQALWYPGQIILVKPLIPDVVPLIGGSGKITLDGILHGIMISIRMAVLLSLIPILTSTTEIEDIVLGLVKVRLPYKYAYMATTAMNMVPTFVDEMNVIKNAQLLRACTVFEEGKFSEKLKAYPSLIVPLVIGAMRRAQAMGTAMDARSFGSRKTRTYINDIQWHNRDTVALTILIVFIIALIVLNIVMNKYGIGQFEVIYG